MADRKRTPYQKRADRRYEEKRQQKPRISGFFVEDIDIAILDKLTDFYAISRKDVLLRALRTLHDETFSESENK